MNTFDFGFDFPREDEVREQQPEEPESFSKNKLGTLITEQHMSEFIDKEIFFIGEFINCRNGILTLKSLNGVVLNCVAPNVSLPDSPKYVGVKGIVTNDLKIRETRGVLFLNIIDPDIVKQYADIYMKHMYGKVFAPSY